MTIPGFTGAASRYRLTLNYTGSAAASPVVDADLVSLQKFLQPACRTGFTYCDEGYCANLRSDVKNCGSCGHECDLGTRCVKGFCMCGSIKCLNGLCSNGKCTCPTGTTLCSGACINLQTDSANCGSCGHTCLSGQECIAGGCKCPDISCKGTCVDSQNDPNNCGGCGIACAKGLVCSSSKCVCPGTFQIPCNGKCCPEGQACNGDSCSCPVAGQKLCTGDNYCCGGPGDLSSQECCVGYGGLSYCTDTSDDFEHCGSCNNDCTGKVTGENAGCYHGVCGNCYDDSSCTNADPLAICCITKGMRMCTNSQTDPLNCGGCGIGCTPGIEACCGGACTNIQNNGANCGACGRSCGYMQDCCGGECYYVDGCNICCGTQVVNSCVDSSNCGTCGNACGADQICCDGVCSEMALYSNSNYIFSNDCQIIHGLTVALQVTQDIVSDSGFSIQVNANSASANYIDAVQQYGFLIMGNSIQGFINNWEGDALTKLVYELTGLCSTTLNNGIPSGYSLTLQLLNDSSGNVVGARYLVYGDGNYLADKTVLGIAQADLAPITAFTVDVVGPWGGLGTTFSPGGAGSLTYGVSGGQLRPLCSVPACAEARGVQTTETSNASYGTLREFPSQSITQQFSVKPRTCTQTNGPCTGARGSDTCVTVNGVTQCCHSNWLYGWYPWIKGCSDGQIENKSCSGPCY